MTERPPVLTVRKTASTASRKTATVAGFFSLNFSRRASIHCNDNMREAGESKCIVHCQPQSCQQTIKAVSKDYYMYSQQNTHSKAATEQITAKTEHSVGETEHSILKLNKVWHLHKLEIFLPPNTVPLPLNTVRLLLNTVRLSPNRALT